MKKSFLLILFMSALMLPMSVYAQQDYCHDLVFPLFNYDEERLAEYPETKLAYDCLFSRNSFYESDTIPAGAPVYNISDVVSKRDSTHVAQDLVVDLTKLSFYDYNFNDFRYRHYETPICFRTPSSAHPYLVMRTYIDVMRITNEATGQ